MIKTANDFLTDIVNNGSYVDCAKQSHENWKSTKERQGWQYGQERDNKKKTNPLMVPFEDLSQEYKGQNSLTPYAVVNFFRVKTGTMSLSELENTLVDVSDGKRTDLVDQMGEYIHSHFIAVELAKGQNVKTRDDLVIYQKLDEDTKSWDTASGLEVVKYLQNQIQTYGGKK
jgi:hypothetical protein